MTTTQQIRPARGASRWRRRLRNHLRTVFARGDFSSLLMTWALMIITALALDAAGWTDGLRLLVPISVLAVGFGFLLARSHYPELLALIMSGMYGLAAVLVVNAYGLTDGGSLSTRTDTLVLQLKIWIGGALAGRQPPNDDIAFVVFLSVMFWFLGHNAAWHVFRVDRVWRVIVPTGLVIITNQFYYQGDRSLDGYLIAFVVVSFLLLIRSHVDAREYDWFMHRVSFPNHVRRTFLQAGGVLAVVLTLAAWNAPTGQDDRSLERVRELASGERLTRFAELWNRLFSSLETQGIATADYYGGDELQLSGAIRLGDQPVMIVTAPYGPRYYWRSTSYDTFDAASWRWRHIRTVRAYTDDPGLRLNIGPTTPGARREVDQSFSMLIRSSKLVYTAPQPIVLGLPVEAELDCVDDFGRTCVNEDRQSDVAIIQPRQTLRAGDTYTVTSSVSTATAAMLRSAGEDYPDWVRRLYLQGVDEVSPRVRSLAAEIVTQAGAQTPYDRARAIERWLRTNIQYNEAIPTPPRGADPVDWFLFDMRQGYCNYYATAMVMMLRTQGIPARLAAGFAQGTWDGERGAFLVRERDAHTWVEVYFPGAGWVEFEPTADQAPIDRPDDPVPQALLPTVTPPPTLTSLPTPTPTPSGGADVTPTDVASAPAGPLALTPTPTTVPTPTTLPPPDPTRVGGEGNDHLLRILLLTLGLLALAATLVVLAALFTVWYIEYRGLGGLNVIQRAYARMGIYARWVGLRFADSATPDERRRYLVGELPEGEMPINAITRTYIADRYGRPADVEPDASSVHLAREAWQAMRWTFIRRKLGRLAGRGRRAD